jgi:hypothetical protein
LGETKKLSNRFPQKATGYPPQDLKDVFHKRADSPIEFEVKRAAALQQIKKYSKNMTVRQKRDKKELSYVIGEDILIDNTLFTANKLSLLEPKYIVPYRILQIYNDSSAKIDHESHKGKYNLKSLKKYIAPYSWMK